MDNLTHHPQVNPNIKIGMPLNNKPFAKAQDFTPIGYKVVFLDNFKPFPETIIKVVRVLGKKIGQNESVDFYIDYNSQFSFWHLLGGYVKIIKPRQENLRGFDKRYTNDLGKMVREQKLSPYGDIVFRAGVIK